MRISCDSDAADAPAAAHSAVVRRGPPPARLKRATTERGRHAARWPRAIASAAHNVAARCNTPPALLGRATAERVRHTAVLFKKSTRRSKQYCVCSYGCSCKMYSVCRNATTAVRVTANASSDCILLVISIRAPLLSISSTMTDSPVIYFSSGLFIT